MVIFKKTGKASSEVDQSAGSVTGSSPIAIAEEARVQAIDAAALEGIRKQAKVFQAIIDVTEILESISSIDGAVNEANRRLTAAREQEAALNSTLSKLRDEIDGLTSKKAGHIAKIEQLLKDATGDAQVMVDNAKTKSASIVMEANKKAEAIVTDANARALECDKQTENAKSQLATLLADIDVATGEHHKLQAAIDSLKAKFS